MRIPARRSSVSGSRSATVLARDAEGYLLMLPTAFAEATVPTDQYLMGMPHLAENLEAGLEALGVDVAGEEADLL